MCVTILQIFLLCVVHCIESCPQFCECRDTTVQCSRQDVPDRVPVGAKELFISGFNYSTLGPPTFLNPVWRDLTLLDIRAESTWGRYTKFIRNGSFVGLDNLEYLGIHGYSPNGVLAGAFRGIDNLRVLDLSNAYNLASTTLVRALQTSSEVVLPQLKNLTMSSVQSLDLRPIDIDEDFIRSLTNSRNITYIDMSNINIKTFDFSYFYLLCDSLRHFKAENLSLGHPKNAEKTTVCESLQTLDLSGTHLGTWFGENSHTFRVFIFLMWLPISHSIENVLLNSVVRKPIVMNSYHLNVSQFPLKTKKFEFRRNLLKSVNFTITLHETLRKSLSDIDFSENVIEYMSPQILYSLENLQILKLAKNNLYLMLESYEDTFEVLLHKSLKLSYLDLSDNKLTRLPATMFKFNNDLKYLDLSKNLLTNLGFDLHKHNNLNIINVGSNMITCLSKGSMEVIDSIHNQNKRTTKQENAEVCMPPSSECSAKLTINLHSNPFECSCSEDSVRYLRWVKTSNSVTRVDVDFSCEFHGKYIDILAYSMDDITDKCDMQALLTSLKIALPIVMVLIIAISIMVVLIRRRFIKKKRYNDFVCELNGNFEKRFLVFLSFCSEDTEFTVTNVLIPLEKALREMTKSDRNFVCVGDKEFRLGLNVQTEVMRCVEESSVVLFIVSKTFCKKAWCRMEINEAYNQNKPTIMLMKEHVNVKDMSSVMRKIFGRYTHASWVVDDLGGHLEPDIVKIGKSIIELARKVSNEEKPEQEEHIM